MLLARKIMHGNPDQGKPFMEFEERKEIIEGFKYVNQVLPFDDSDDTASDLIKRVYTIYNSKAHDHNYSDLPAQGMLDYYQIYFYKHLMDHDHFSHKLEQDHFAPLHY